MAKSKNDLTEFVIQMSFLLKKPIGRPFKIYIVTANKFQRINLVRFK